MSRPARSLRATQTPKEISVDTQKQQEARPESPASCFCFTNSSRLFRHYCPPKPPVFVNESIGFVQQSQWNRSTKSMESLNKTNGFVSKNCQFNDKKLAEKLNKTGGLVAAKHGSPFIISFYLCPGKSTEGAIDYRQGCQPLACHHPKFSSPERATERVTCSVSVIFWSLSPPRGSFCCRIITRGLTPPSGFFRLFETLTSPTFCFLSKTPMDKSVGDKRRCF